MKDSRKDIAEFMLNSLKQKSFREKLGFLNTDFHIVKAGSPAFRLLISTEFPSVKPHHRIDDNAVQVFWDSDDLKLLIEVGNEVRWILLKESAKTFFKFCLYLIAALIFLNTLF
jgi:hypothetical protein